MKNCSKIILYCTFIVLALPLEASEASNESAIEACTALNSRTANDDQTIGTLRQQCKNSTRTLIGKRSAYEQAASKNPFAILPHKPNYLLPATYFDANALPYRDIFQGYHLDDVEAKFQVSIKYMAIENIHVDALDLQFAFTATSWWQSYNSDISAPFRETNYEPELILSYTKPWSLLGLTVENSAISLNHQSNGQAGVLSRSWNRIIGRLTFSNDQYVWTVRTWWRFPEDDKTIIDGVAQPGGDDNPDIAKYMGNGELGFLWRPQRNLHINVLLRNNLRSNNKGAVLLGWSFPLNTHLLGYVEYFNGYGESLIYYNHSIKRIGLGVKLTDWL